MECPNCKAVAARIMWKPGMAWCCPECATRGEYARVFWFKETIADDDGSGWGRISKADQGKWAEDGAYVDREVDAKGDVTTHPVSRRAAKRVYFIPGLAR